ncbi:Membrane protein involved in the export of O-antigen and teichoic acid [Ekhidna lutea]|uniref:Membrane protein involved in the export of O-antigen and teichoic acid n=1 Tax=Ekhidna lutea TaxID=447679 RepID=A0A239LZQ8_EKHLU|nr:polysaccharide biosynthesis protein [Ekhidna lutea]SNT35996.1 Membrane protein involved in the export of O-antigen and teichoic acid [Ekhidna lutea]
MGVVIKQSFWGTVIAYLGVLIGYVNTLYFRAEYFDLSQIGLFTLITANAMIISPISSFGTGSAYIKFFPHLSGNQKNQFFTLLLIITLIGNALIVGAGYLLSDVIAERYNETAPNYIYFLPVTGMIIVANSLFDLLYSYSRSIMKVIFPSFLRDIYIRIGSLTMVIGFAFQWWSFESAVFGLGIIYFSTFLLLFIHCSLDPSFKLDLKFREVAKAWKKPFIRFGGYSMLLAGSFAVLNNVTYDQVTALLGPEMNGIFTTCVFIALIVEMPKRNMAKVMGPILSTEFERNNLKEVGALYKRSSITMSVIGMLLFIGIVTNTNDLFNFIPKGNAFAEGYWVVVGVCLAKLVLMVSGFPGEIINFSVHYKYNVLFQIVAAAVLILLNVTLIPIWGLNGAVFSYFIAITLHISMKVLFVYYRFQIHPLVPAHLVLLVIGAITIIIGELFQPGFHPLINIIIRSLVVSCILIMLVYRFKISTDINTLIHSTFERFLKINLPK